jgi:hypothetical protein
MDQVAMINPIIVTNSSWLKNRQYHTMPSDSNNVAVAVPVYAPTNAVAVEITHYLATMQPRNSDPYVASQFDIRLQASCDVKYWFDHVSTLAEPFANQERYEKTGELSSLLHAVCPYDYYSAEVRAAFMAKFGWWNGSAQGPTACGASVDVIEPDDSFPPADWGFVSKIEADGSVYLAGPSWGVRTDSDNSTFVDPTIMTTEHCYQHYSNPTSWAYVRILSDLEIAAAHGEGTCPATMPTDSIIYYR